MSEGRCGEGCELEYASGPNSPLVRYKRAMVVIEANRKRIAELEADLARALPVVEAAGALVGHRDFAFTRHRINYEVMALLDALARAYRAAREPRTGEQG